MAGPMKDCDRYADGIPFFDDLSAEERRELLRHAEGCPACRKQLTDVRAILTGLARRGPGHIDGDLLTRYAVHRADPGRPGYDGRHLAPAELASVEAHLQGCARCRDEVDRTLAEYRSMERDFRDQGLAALELGGAPARGHAAVIPLFGRVHEPRRALAALALAAALALVWVGPFFRGISHDFYRLGVVGDYEVTVTRGGSTLREEAYSAFRLARYDEAIEKLERFLAGQLEDPSRGEAQVTVAVAYLATAKHDFLGRFERVDTARVGAALRHLDSAAASDGSAIREDAQWYRAIALLLRGDAQGARAAFDAVARLGGSRATAANRLIGEVDALTK